MRSINLLVVHCSDTPSEMDIGVNEIRRWHVEDNGWSDIGYHYVIRRNGDVEIGRPLDRSGAHTKGYNANSIGVCLVGRDFFTSEQFLALAVLYRTILGFYPNIDFAGHRDLDSNKTCPNFEVAEILDGEE